MTDSDSRAALDASIDAIEGGYEYLLAYAAQGRRTDRGGNSDNSLRNHLSAMVAALDVLPAQVRDCAGARSETLAAECAAYFSAVANDAAIARGALTLVLAQDDIGSQLVDNLNASIHLRAVLTDIFLIDEALKPASA